MSFQDAVTKSSEGVCIRLHVVPSSSQALFPTGYNPWRKCLEIKVTAEAKDNKATQEAISLVASFFSLQDHDVTVISGQKSRQKNLFLRRITYESVVSLLKGVLHE